MKILVIAEHNNEAVKPATLNTIAAATQLGDDIEVLVLGENCTAAVDSLKSTASVKKVLFADNSALAAPLAEAQAPIISEYAKSYTHILAPATTYGKNLMPRVAALLDVAAISEISAIHAEDTFSRPIYAGNAIAKVKSNDQIKVITVRATAFDAVVTQGGEAVAESIDVNIDNNLSQYVGEKITKLERPELTSAEIVISGGRALQSSENFKLIEQLADCLGAAVGASRAAVDAGYVPNDFQVGQTGKVVAPKLYIAIGISGAIQHLAGMKDSKVIVAINKDEDAPIFQIADYGLVGDLFEIVPQMIEELT